MARKPVSYLAGSVVIGSVVGVVVGLLTAPKSGRDTRKNIKHRAVDVSKQVPQQLMALPGRGRDALKRVPKLFRKDAPDEATEPEAIPDADDTNEAP